MNESHKTPLVNLICAFSNWVVEEAGHDESQLEPDRTVLLAVHAHPGVSIREIAAMLRLSHSGAVRVVDRLQAAGTVRRTRAADRRTVSLELTEDGWQRARDLLETQMAVIMERLACLAPQDWNRLATLLEQLLAGVATTRTEAWRICRWCDHSTCRGRDCAVGRHLA